MIRPGRECGPRRRKWRLDAITAQLSTTHLQPFDAVAAEYDTSFTHSLIGRAQRQSVWREIDRWFRPGQRILEINCGTGVDAVHLAEGGMRVEACDASARMIEVARKRREESPFAAFVNFRVLCIEEIAHLKLPDACDGLLSNFAGLNCVEDLRGTARNLAPYVRAGGKAILCFFGPSCAWEILEYGLRGDISWAFRRLRGGSREANLAPGRKLTVRYPTVRSICRDFKPYFRLVSWKGVGIAVPPSYLEPWAVRFPRALKAAARLDARLGPVPGFRALADHVLLVFERVDA